MQAPEASRRTAESGTQTDDVVQQTIQTRFPAAGDENEDDEEDSFTEASAASAFEVFDLAVRGIESSSLDGNPRIHVVGSHRGLEFEFQVNSTLNSTLTYAGQEYFIPSYVVLCSLLTSLVLTAGLALAGLPFMFSWLPSGSSSSSGGSPSGLSKLLEPKTLDDYGILWLSWHAFMFLANRALALQGPAKERAGAKNE